MKPDMLAFAFGAKHHGSAWNTTSLSPRAVWYAAVTICDVTQPLKATSESSTSRRSSAGTPIAYWWTAATLTMTSLPNIRLPFLPPSWPRHMFATTNCSVGIREVRRRVPMRRLALLCARVSQQRRCTRIAADWT